MEDAEGGELWQTTPKGKSLQPDGREYNYVLLSSTSFMAPTMTYHVEG